MAEDKLYCEMLSALLETLPRSSFVFVLSPDGIYREIVSYPDIERLTMAPDDHPGKTIEEVVPAPLRGAARCFFDQAVREKKQISYCYPHYNDRRWWMCRVIVPIVHNDQVVSVVMEVYDCGPPVRLPESYVVP